MGENLLGRWRRETGGETAVSISNREKISPQEYERLRRELAKVKTERDIKKWRWLLRGRPQMKYGFIAKYRNVWPARTMCRVLDVSSSGLYHWFERPPCQRERHNAKLLQAIKDIHEASDRTYGSPRVVHDLLDAGLACSEDRVARLMKAAGINGADTQQSATSVQYSLKI